MVLAICDCHRNLQKERAAPGDGAIVGSMAMQQATSVERALWPAIPVGRIMRPLSPEDTVTPETDAFTALAQMRRTGQSRLVVLQRGSLLGIVSSRDLLEILSLEQELHRHGSRPTGPLVPQ